ncbi:MAG: fused MFS/spermidine synthase [Rhizomicrobium sp.]
MTALDLPAVSPRAAAPGRLVPAVVYAATVFLSAGLLFFLEPMFSKMALPLLGGSSAVWSVAMVVFQGLLLAGYLYAYLLTRTLPVRLAAIVHAGVLAAGLLSLPIAVQSGFGAPPAQGVSLWLIGLFLASVGLPCFALSANAPLLQAWFARRGAAESTKAYFLYRASNLGSFAILLSYPFAIEPNIGLAGQSRLWSIGYLLLAVAVAACGVLVWRLPATFAAAAAPVSAAAIRWRDRIAWMAFAFVPSGLLVAVTAHIATDVASAPFLWIVPLALYLLTFVFVFTDKPTIGPRAMLALQPATVAGLVLLFLWTTHVPWGLALLGHLAAFFVAAMVCHARLYARRPDAAELTQFYVWMSLGGVLGGIFAALVAPQIFHSVAEYPLLAFAALLLRRDVWTTPRAAWLKDGIFALGIAGALAAAFFLLGKPVALFAVGIMALAALLALSGTSPARFLPLAALLLAASHFYDPSQSIVYRGRSFYGVYKAVDIDGGRFRVLFQGTTAHGGERLRNDDGSPTTGRPDPLTYYYRGGPFSSAIQAQRARMGGTLHDVTLVGLGMGALTCDARPGERWTLYELDPLSVAIAHDTALFRSVSACAPAAPVVLGDGRLTLRDARPGVELLILDVFSSDAVPTHMLTREAFALYKARLAPHGTIAINISNQHLRLAEVVAASAEANGMVTAVKRDPQKTDRAKLHMQAEIAVVARDAADMAALKLGPDWRIVRGDGTRVWTDDYSAILDAITAKLRE